MSDTVILGRTVSGSFKAVLLYILADGSLSVGQAFSSMERADWDAMWWLQRVGFFVGLVGSTALTIKAFYSGSAPAKPPPTLPGS